MGRASEVELETTMKKNERRRRKVDRWIEIMGE